MPPEDQLRRLFSSVEGQGFAEVRVAYVDARGTAVSRMEVGEIMGRERANHTSMHLYCTGPYWVAFERSAYQLRRAFPDSETTPMRLFGYPFPVVMVSVTDRSLRSYARKHILRIDEPDYKRLTVPVFPAEDYRSWHEREVSGLPYPHTYGFQRN